VRPFARDQAPARTGSEQEGCARDIRPVQRCNRHTFAPPLRAREIAGTALRLGMWSDGLPGQIVHRDQMRLRDLKNR
jgi:hypothetical protein